ncbi:hypothetical protein [Tunicatimonas pelagia]|uniref:hypothetical protein n=1 Tax=Tunicatimonas pelagia TaxID=931531 RepID=UPI002665DB6E|nr:hypothetical protein [Tunicatimonas pelagia]WKN42651.1 hypothetical protein P0M28_26795 [Tunicatimonas pelagia]
MLNHIRMPYLVRALCGATIGFLVSLYIVNTYFGGSINFIVYLSVVAGAGAGIYFFRR